MFTCHGLLVFALALTIFGCADDKASSDLRSSQKKAGDGAGGTGADDEDNNWENTGGGNGDNPTGNGDSSSNCADNPKPFVSIWKVEIGKAWSFKLASEAHAENETENIYLREVKELGGVGWNTSKVTDMSYMFHDARKADPDFSKWNSIHCQRGGGESTPY